VNGKTPYLTLAGVAAIFVVLLVVNMTAASGGSGGSGEYGSGSAQSEPDEAAPDETEAEPDEAEPDENEAEPEENEEGGGAAFPHKAVYAGHTAEHGPALAVAILDEDAAAYFCDGVSAEAWMKGSAKDGEILLSGSHGASIDGRMRGNALTGRVTVDDQSYQFTIKPADPPAGLYRADLGDGDTTIGWIVLPDGSQVGIQESGSETEPAPELTPGGVVDVNGQSVEPQVVQGDADF
jgi:hypothetical protein